MKLIHPHYRLEELLKKAGIPPFSGPTASPTALGAWRRVVSDYMERQLPAIYPAHVFEGGFIKLQELSTEHRLHATSLMWGLKFKETGENTFRVGPYMADRLSSASLKGVDLEDVKLPFPFFFLQFESPVLVVDREGAEDGRPVWAYGAYVMDYSEEFPVITHNRARSFQVEVALLKEGDSLPFFVGAWPDIDSTTGVLHDTNAKGERGGAIADGLRPINEDAPEDWYKRASVKLADIVRTSINLALYLASINCEIMEVNEGAAAKAKLRHKVKRLTGRAKRRAQERLEAHGGIRYIQVGPTKERQARDYKRLTGKTMGRGWRRAHWHSYWVGARKDIHGNVQLGDEKVLKWIDACEVNPHLEGGSPRVYSVREAV